MAILEANCGAPRKEHDKVSGRTNRRDLRSRRHTERQNLVQERRGEMSESGSEHRARVASMISDDGGTWDLSPNDKAALRHVMDLIDKLAEESSETDGIEPWEAIEWAERLMEGKP